METTIKIRNEASLCTIDIEGVIGVPESEQFGQSSQSVATYERFREVLEQIKSIEAEEVLVNIRSTGGDVNDALLIYESLATLDARITTRCYGYTASAATIIAQAASEGAREIAASALYLVHLSSSSVEGNSSDLAERMALLEKTDDRIASLYASRSGRSKEEFLALMAENGGRGKWLSPEEVVAAGLADAIIGAEEPSKPSIVERVRGWFSAQKPATKELPSDVNILHLPEDALPHSSTIAFEEGQCRFRATQLSAKEDPSLEGYAQTHNAQAYAEDMMGLKHRAL